MDFSLVGGVAPNLIRVQREWEPLYIPRNTAVRAVDMVHPVSYLKLGTMATPG
jgi:hypothetical protein